MNDDAALLVDERGGQIGAVALADGIAGGPEPCEATTAGRVTAVMAPRLGSDKIQGRHLERLAIVYVRQSSPQQVMENRESRARQYALADYAVALGWPTGQVLVIDEDQGRSGRSAEHRVGFQRVLAELTMDHVGIVLGLEMSRLARSNKDWHHLLEVCALFSALLGDQDGLYDPNDSNDRLLLGLKGTMSEVELFTMRNRLDRGRLNKAGRGELFISAPVGYVKLPSGQIALEPHEQARGAVQLIFEKFGEIGSVRGVFRYMVNNGIRLGFRAPCGPRRGELEWRLPTMPTVGGILKHPFYAGAYAFGRQSYDAKQRATGAKRARPVPMEQWKVLIKDCLAGYITWDEYLANQRQLQQNRMLPTTPGVARGGCALLTGLVVCGTCGRRMQAQYPARHAPHYKCEWHVIEGREQRSHALSAAPLDALVAAQILKALEPAALDLSIAAAESIEQERARLHQHWKQQLQRAGYDVQHAERQYQLVDPENRLVARTLEQRWEQALRDQRQLQDDYDRFLHEQPPHLTHDERLRIRALASDMPALWNAPGTSPTDRKEITRCLVERVVVHMRPDSEYVDVTIQWQGGLTSAHEIVRRVRLYTQLRDYDRLLDRIEALRRAGHTVAAIAARLDAEGFVPPMRRGTFQPEMVCELMARRGLADEKRVEPLDEHEWWLVDLAGRLEMSAMKLRSWTCHGWVHARQTAAQRLWILWVDEDELGRLLRLKAHSIRGVTIHPEELTRPKVRPTQQPDESVHE